VKIGVLTGGGDCPGLNPALRAIVMRGFDYGDELIGIMRGWAGLIELETRSLSLEAVEDIVRCGGTILESSRSNPCKREEDLRTVLHNIGSLGLEALIALGGEDTLGAANQLQKVGVKLVGVPKTMDNDLSGTDYTFGFDSAVAVAVEAADRLRDTARSHRRVMVLEVMGRHAGWVALHTAVGSGADWVLIPEVPLDLEEMCEHLGRLRQRGRNHGLVIVSEGAEITQADEESLTQDEFGHIILRERGVGEFIAKEIESRTGFETRLSVLGHIVRGGPPTAFDRWLATRVGLKAVELVHEGKFGYMAALQGGEITAVPLAEAVKELKTVPVELYEEVKALFR
jgi:6-phosphofructokinase 1